jgi:hypothetical protein
MTFCHISLLLGVVTGAILELNLQADYILFMLEEFFNFFMDDILDGGREVHMDA